MSTRRRANGEGSIYRRNSTGQWVAAITISGGHGTPPAKKTKHAKTRTEANRLLRQLQAEIDEGPPLDDNRITIADWCHQWCDTIAPQNASPATVSDYYWTLDHYVLPHLGGYQLRELAPRHVAEFQNALIASGKAKGTVRHARSPLSAALNHAVRCSMIRTNPCAVVPQPRNDNKVARTKKSLTYDEAQRLLDATRDAEASLRAFVEFGLYRGPRRSEILGLKWADIDADAEVIRIRRRLREERLRAKDGTYVVRLQAGEPKTPKSQRDLSLRGPVGATVRALRADQNRRRLAAGTDWGDSGYLFTTTNGDPVYPSTCTAGTRNSSPTTACRTSVSTNCVTPGRPSAWRPTYGSSRPRRHWATAGSRPPRTSTSARCPSSRSGRSTPSTITSMSPAVP